MQTTRMLCSCTPEKNHLHKFGNGFRRGENEEVDLGVPGWTTYEGVQGRKEGDL